MMAALRTLAAVTWLTVRIGARMTGIAALLGIVLIVGLLVATKEGGPWHQAVEQMRSRNAQAASHDDLPLRGTRIAVEGPDTARQSVITALRRLGATVIDAGTDPEEDNRLTYRQSVDATHYWDLKSKAHRSSIERALRDASQTQQRAWLRLRPESFYRQALHVPPAEPLRYASLQTIMVSSVLMLAAYILVMFAGSMIGVEWDMDRTAGRLEPWALVEQPLWALYGGQALGGGLLASGALLVLFLVAKAGGLGLMFPMGMALVAIVGASTVLVGIYGVLTTMLFRHRFGRTFARLLLSPFNLLLLLGISSLRARQGQTFWLNLMEGRVGDVEMALVLLAFSVAMIALAGLLVPIIEWRIGVRRQGLRRL